MATKWQMNPTSRVSLTAAQAGEKSQSNGPEDTIVSSILTDLIFKRSSIVGPNVEPAKQASSSNEFQNFKLTQISPSSDVNSDWVVIK